MKSILSICAIAGILYACGPSTKENTESADTTAVNSMYSYSNSFEIADTANLRIVRDWNDAIEEGNIDKAFSYAADSLDVIFSDGSYYNSTKDSLKRMAENMMQGMSNIRVDYIAGIPAHSIDKGDTWVFSYTDESFTASDGDHRNIVHEVYRIENGMIRSVFAYNQAPTEADPAPDKDYGDTYMYSGSFEIGKSANLDLVMDFINSLYSKDTTSIGKYLADSVTVFFSNGGYVNNVRDSVVQMISHYVRDNSISATFTASIPLRSTDRNLDWVLVWMDETITGPDGENKVILHEAYWIVNNKIRGLRQFERKPGPADE